MAYFIIQLTLGLSQGGFCYHSTKIPPFGDSKLSIGTESTLATLEQLPTYRHYRGIGGPLCGAPRLRYLARAARCARHWRRHRRTSQSVWYT